MKLTEKKGWNGKGNERKGKKEEGKEMLERKKKIKEGNGNKSKGRKLEISEDKEREWTKRRARYGRACQASLEASPYLGFAQFG